MAFAVTGFTAYPISLDAAIERRADQAFVLTITGTTADVALDIANPTGTFWTAAGSSTIGAQALTAMKQIQLIQAHRISCNLSGVDDLKQQVATGATLASTQFKYTSLSTDSIPSYALFAGEGLTSYKLDCRVALLTNKKPITAVLGTIY